MAALAGRRRRRRQRRPPHRAGQRAGGDRRARLRHEPRAVQRRRPRAALERRRALRPRLDRAADRRRERRRPAPQAPGCADRLGPVAERSRLGRFAAGQPQDRRQGPAESRQGSPAAARLPQRATVLGLLRREERHDRPRIRWRLPLPAALRSVRLHTAAAAVRLRADIPDRERDRRARLHGGRRRRLRLADAVRRRAALQLGQPAGTGAEGRAVRPAAEQEVQQPRLLRSERMVRRADARRRGRARDGTRRQDPLRRRQELRNGAVRIGAAGRRRPPRRHRHRLVGRQRRRRARLSRLAPRLRQHPADGDRHGHRRAVLIRRRRRRVRQPRRQCGRLPLLEPLRRPRSAARACRSARAANGSASSAGRPRCPSSARRCSQTKNSPAARARA